VYGALSARVAACRDPQERFHRAGEGVTILERVPHREFDHAAVNRVQRLTRGISVLVGLREVPVAIGEPQRHIGIVTGSVELRQRVVQEVEGFKNAVEPFVSP
jgi:hypothetical protein